MRDQETSNATESANAHSLQRLVKRQCVLCGARVRNQNPKTETCDPLCTRAKHNGRTRQQQIEWEIAQAEEHQDEYQYHAEDYCGGCGMLRSQCDCSGTP